jgi:hypothetical protein
MTNSPRVEKSSRAVLSLCVTGLAILVALPIAIGQGPPNPGTTPTRAPRNLVPNGSFAGPRGWRLFKGAIYDPSTSHTPGSGSVKLTAPGDQVQSTRITIHPGTEYTFSAFMRTSAWPVVANSKIAVYDHQGKFKYNWRGSYQGTTQENSWQECAITYRPLPGDASVALVFERIQHGKSPRDDGAIWVDDLFFCEGIHFRRPPTPKKPFQGSVVRVDALGNFEVLRRGAWQPFFPFGIYQVSSKDFGVYSQQGFNCIMNNNFSANQITKASKAVSRLNPDGMMSVLEIGAYVDSRQRLYKDLTELQKRLKTLEEAGPAIQDHILAIYWDNEQYTEYDLPAKVIAMVRKADLDRQEHPKHPVLMLQGSQGMTRMFTRMADVAADYIRDEQTNTFLDPQEHIEGRMAILNNLEGQTIPASLGIISEEETAVGVRRQVYEHLIAGGRGIAYFRDGAAYNYNGDKSSPAAKDITLRQCWAEFPRLRSEIDRALPILRESQHAEWRVKSSDQHIRWGCRTHKGEGYLIVLNPTSHAAQTTLNLEGLRYDPREVKDYFSGRVVAQVNRKEFRVNLAPGASTILHLSR